MAQHRKTKSGFTSISCRPETLARFNKMLARLMMHTGRRPSQDEMLNLVLDHHDAIVQNEGATHEQPVPLSN